MRLNMPNIQPDSAVSFDTLLAFARGTLSEGEYTRVKTHLAHTPEDEEVLAGIRLFMEQEADADMGLEIFLDEMEHDYEAILTTYEAEKAIDALSFLPDSDAKQALITLAKLSVNRTH